MSPIQYSNKCRICSWSPLLFLSYGGEYWPIKSIRSSLWCHSKWDRREVTVALTFDFKIFSAHELLWKYHVHKNRTDYLPLPLEKHLQVPLAVAVAARRHKNWKLPIVTHDLAWHYFLMCGIVQISLFCGGGGKVLTEKWVKRGCKCNKNFYFQHFPHINLLWLPTWNLQWERGEIKQKDMKDDVIRITKGL